MYPRNDHQKYLQIHGIEIYTSALLSDLNHSMLYPHHLFIPEAVIGFGAK